jgi:hypothetical protein
MEETKFGLSGFYKPTPTKWRKVGDVLLAGSVVISTQFPEDPKMILISSIAGVVGKFITNLFHKD